MPEDEEVEVSTVDDESEFDAAFNEIAEARDSDPVEEIDEEVDVDQEIEAAASVEEAAENIAAAVTEDEDPYAGMTDEVKAKFVALEGDRDSLQHTIDSDAGRVRAFQRKADDLDKEIQSIRSGATSGPSMTQISDAMKGTDEEWDKFGESYPDVAGAIDRRMAALGAATESAVEETLKPVKEKAVRDAETEAADANKTRVAEVEELFPTWTDAVKTQDFKDWMADQSQGVAALAESDDSRDASTLIGLYDTHLVANGKPTLKADPPTGVNEDEVDSAAEPQLSELEKKRAKQLEDGAAPTSRKAGVNTDGPETTEFDAAFAVFAKRKEQKRA